MTRLALTPPTLGFLGAGAAFLLSGALAWQTATAPVGLISVLLSVDLLPSDMVLAGAIPDALALALSRLLFLLALPSFAAAGFCAFLTQKRLQ